MAEEQAPAVAAETPAKKSTKKAAKPKKKAPASTHPPCAEMIATAIVSLKERNGSSLQAIKKYIAANYKCDVDKLSAHIRKALKSGVVNGKLVQTKGKGASGSFKVSSAAAKPKKAAKKAVKKPAKKATKQAKPAKKPKKAKKTKKTAEKKPKKATKTVAKKPAAKKHKPKKAAKKTAAKKGKK